MSDKEPANGGGSLMEERQILGELDETGQIMGQKYQSPLNHPSNEKQVCRSCSPENVQVFSTPPIA